MKNNAVVVVAAGILLAEETRKTTKLYALRIGADHVVIDVPRMHVTGPGRYKYGRFEKFQAYDVLQHYRRVLVLDADVLITPEAPNIFAEVPDECVGGVRMDVELSQSPGLVARKRREITEAQEGFGQIKGWTEGYMNSGVVVASDIHAAMYALGECHVGPPLVARIR